MDTKKMIAEAARFDEMYGSEEEHIKRGSRDHPALQKIDAEAAAVSGFIPEYEWWRHGGWYVSNVRHPSGGCGCVSRNYPDKKWRIVCDPRPFDTAPTFKTRDEAARAEYALTLKGGL